jgi:hypothetical protein
MTIMLERTNENVEQGAPLAAENPSDTENSQVAERNLLVDLAVKAAEGVTFGSASGGAGWYVKKTLDKFGGQGPESNDHEGSAPPDASPPQQDADPPA